MNAFKKCLLGIAIVLLSTLSISTAFLPTVAYADPVDCDTITGTGGFLGFPNWNSGLTCDVGANGQPYTVIDSIPTFIWTIVLNVIDILMRIAGMIAVVMLLFNGFQYMTSGGQADKIAAAKKGLLQAIVGLLITVMAVSIIGFIVGRIG
jgi:hypothetical protein